MDFVFTCIHLFFVSFECIEIIFSNLLSGSLSSSFSLGVGVSIMGLVFWVLWSFFFCIETCVSGSLLVEFFLSVYLFICCSISISSFSGSIYNTQEKTRAYRLEVLIFLCFWAGRSRVLKVGLSKIDYFLLIDTGLWCELLKQITGRLRWALIWKPVVGAWSVISGEHK